jgi:xylose isomerase
MSDRQWFPGVPSIPFEGPVSDNPLAFTHYDADAIVAGKPMREHLRFAVCYWHSMKGTGADPFGVGCRNMPWAVADDPMPPPTRPMDAMFELDHQARGSVLVLPRSRHRPGGRRPGDDQRPAR